MYNPFALYMPRSTKITKASARSRVHSLFIAAAFLVLLTLHSIPPHWGAMALLTYHDARAVSIALETNETRLPESARALLRDARAWRVELTPFIQAAPLFKGLVYFGGDLEQTPQLAVCLDETLNAAQTTLALYEKLSPQLQRKSAGAALVAFSQANAQSISDARAIVQDARAKYDAVDTENFSPHAHAFMRNVRAVLNEWDAGLSLLERAPQLLGADSPKRYLLLAQNNDELRPTGGFITAVGVIKIEAGEIIVEAFGDSLAVDDLTLIHPPPPAPLEKYMWASQWLVRDSNWYANFPSSADVVQSMYARDHQLRTDGVIAVDMKFLPLLVAAVSDLEMDGVLLTRANVIEFIKAGWKPLPTSDYMNAEWFQSNRKNFLGELLKLVMTRVKTGKVSSAALAQAVWRGMQTKSVQIYFNDAGAQQAARAAGWGGVIEAGSADYLNVIDSNVGFNKVNARVTREIFYQVRLHKNGGDATVEILYHNPSRPESDACDLLRQHKDTTYASMEHSCYWNYVRVLAPRFSQFVSAQGVQDADYAEDIDAVTALGGYFVVNRNSDARAEFRYSLPDTILQNNAYSLTLQTQAGAPATPMRIRVAYPPHWTMRATTDAFTRINNHTIEFQQMLARDKTLTIYFDP